jgi:hypothetical protein
MLAWMKRKRAYHAYLILSGGGGSGLCYITREHDAPMFPDKMEQPNPTGGVNEKMDGGYSRVRARKRCQNRHRQ